MKEAMRDSEFASGIPASYTGIVAGYFGGSNAAHMWTPDEWARFRKNKKLPIWVPGPGSDGLRDGGQAIESLYFIGARKGCLVVVDMETRVDKTYVRNFGGVMQYAGFYVLVYGSASTVFQNPKLNGYWVADYAGKGPFMYPGARMTQYADPGHGSGGNWDSSTVAAWTARFGKFWR